MIHQCLHIQNKLLSLITIHHDPFQGSRCESSIKLIIHKLHEVNQTDCTSTTDGWYRDCFYSWLDNSVSCWLYDVIMCFLTLAGRPIP